MRVAGRRLAQRKLGLSLETRNGRTQLMGCVRNEALLGSQREAQALEKLVHRANQRTYFLGCFLDRQRRKIAVRPTFDFAAQRFQRCQAASHCKPEHQARKNDEQQLGQHHARENLRRKLVARRAVLRDLHHDHAFGLPRLQREPQRDDAHGPAHAFSL